jgi:hypothetical protein
LDISAQFAPTKGAEDGDDCFEAAGGRTIANAFENPVAALGGHEALLDPHFEVALELADVEGGAHCACPFLFR